MLTEKAKQQEEMLVEYDEGEAQQKDLESELDLLRAQVDSMKDELKVSTLMCVSEQPEPWHTFCWSSSQLTSHMFADGTPEVLVMILLLFVDSDFFFSYS